MDDGNIDAPDDLITHGRESRRRLPLWLRVIALAAVALLVLGLLADRTILHDHRPSAAVPVLTPPSVRVASRAPAVRRAGRYEDYCGPSPDCPQGNIPSTLRRPLRPVTLPGGRCPTTPERAVQPGIGTAEGSGPVFAVTGDPNHHGSVVMAFPPDASSLFAGSKESGQRTFWLVAPTYHGPVLIRGRQLDGSDPVLFSTDVAADLLTDLVIPPSLGLTSGWRDWATYTRVAAPGCYAWQVDGTTFSYAVPFVVVQLR